MATNIGPKIGIDGEKEYRQSINNIIEQQKTLKSEMKAVSSAMDSETSAMKKAKKEKELLTKQIENQEQRIRELNKMLDESVKKYGENDVKTLKWKQAVNEATVELNAMKKELDDLPGGLDIIGEKFTAAGDKIKGIGSSVSNVGGEITKFVTGPIAAVGAASMAAWNEVDGGLDTIIKKTGASGEALDGMQQAMENLATSIPTSFDAAANAVGEVNTRFGLTGQELEDLSGAFIRFAELNGVDVSGSIDRVQAAMEAFGVSSDQAKFILDMLNKAGQDTGVSIDKLSSDLTTNATALQSMGFSINSSIGFLANLNKSGIDSAAVMAGMKKALQEATKEGVPLNEALMSLQTQLQGAKTDTEAMQIAMDLFGNKAGPQLAAAIQEGRLSFDAFSNTVKDWSGSVQSTFDATLDPIDETTTLMNEFKIVGAEIGTTLMEMAVPALKTIAEVVQDLKGRWDGLDGSQKELIVKFGLIAAAVGPVISVVGTLISVVGTISSVVGAVLPVIGALSAPFLGVAAAIAAAVAAGVAIYKNWDEIKVKASEIWETVTNTVKTAIEKMKNFMKFKWELPKLKLPHFSIEGKFSLSPPSVPHLSVDWYARAMQDGMILTRPTIFGAQDGRLLAGGEAGPEVVVGASSLFDMIQSAVGTTTYNNGGNTIYVYGAPGQDVSELAREVADIINADVRSQGAVWA